MKSESKIEHMIHINQLSKVFRTEEVETKALNEVNLTINQGEFVTISSDSEGARLLILGGQPINEPIASYGPFVMNTQAEIMQTIQDYQSGKMGFLEPVEYE